MRNFEERKAEVLRRSENRIKERRKKRKRILALCIPLCLFFAVMSVTILPDMMNWIGMKSDKYDKTDTMHQTTDANSFVKGEDYENFTFSLTWNVYGVSSYDSATGKLVKTTDASVPDDYVTTLHLSSDQHFKIWKLICDLDIEQYPDEYDPHEDGVCSKPSMTLILTFRNGSRVKTVSAENIALSYNADNTKGQKFLDVCKEISDIITATDEWKALPEYEFFMIERRNESEKNTYLFCNNQSDFNMRNGHQSDGMRNERAGKEFNGRRCAKRNRRSCRSQITKRSRYRFCDPLI